MRFRLFPFRSPLLRESLRFLFLWLLRCFTSPGTLRIPMNSAYDFSIKSRWVSPFGHPRVKACLGARRGLSHPTTSFIVFLCQGIHRAPLLKLRTTKTLRVFCSLFVFIPTYPIVCLQIVNVHAVC